jgi:hypothetical protein
MDTVSKQECERDDWQWDESARQRDVLDLLRQMGNFLEDHADVCDGPDGEQRPNEAMSMLRDVDAMLTRLERAGWDR